MKLRHIFFALIMSVNVTSCHHKPSPPKSAPLFTVRSLWIVDDKMNVRSPVVALMDLTVIDTESIRLHDVVLLTQKSWLRQSGTKRAEIKDNNIYGDVIKAHCANLGIMHAVFPHRNIRLRAHR